MAVQSDTTSAPFVTAPSSEISNVYREGIVAGILGAATIALWFLILDIFSAPFLYTQFAGQRSFPSRHFA